MANQQIDRGQRYRDINPRAFGRTGSDWIVEEVQTSRDGIQHARLVCVSDPTVRKTLAAAVLGDLRRFARMPPS